MFLSVFIFAYSTFPVIGADIDSLNDKDYAYVVKENANNEDSSKDKNTSDASTDKQNNRKGSSNSWDVAFWVGSAGCLVLAVILAIRSGNKKYGKD